MVHFTLDMTNIHLNNLKNFLCIPIKLTQLFFTLLTFFHWYRNDYFIVGVDGIQQVVNDSNASSNNTHMNEQLMNRPPPPAAHTNLLHMAGKKLFI